MLHLWGGGVECVKNEIWRFDYASAEHWVSIFNTAGGIGFFVAGVAGIDGVTGGAFTWWVDCAYLVGSLLFLAGSSVMLWMWKSEHYGLGMIRDLNVERGEGEQSELEEFVLSMHAQYGCGRASRAQVPWLLIYVLNATASVLDVALAMATSTNTLSYGQHIMTACLNFGLSHGVSFLGGGGAHL